MALCAAIIERAPRARWLRRETAVVVQEAAEPFTTLDRRGRIGVVVGRRGDRVDQCVVETLMIALAVIVLNELGDLISIGKTNSNHFGDQASLTYLAYHLKAVDINRKCGDLWTKSMRLFNAIAPQCSVIALMYEAYGLHFLQDRWAIGHMWNRWGAPDIGAFESDLQAETIAAVTAFVHGAEAKTHRPDGLNSGTPVSTWGFANAVARFVGVGDLHADDLLSRVEYAEQRRWLLGCTAASIEDLKLAPTHPFRDQFPLDSCTNAGWATNASLADAVDVTLPKPLSSEELRIHPEELSAAGPLRDVLKIAFGTHIDILRLQRGFLPVVKAIRRTAKLEPLGLSLAKDKLPPMDGVPNGSAFVDRATAAVQQDVNITFDFSRSPAFGTNESIFMRATQLSSCHTLATPEMLTSLMDACQDTSGDRQVRFAACDLCDAAMEIALTVEKEPESPCSLIGMAGLRSPDHFCVQGGPKCKYDPAMCPAPGTAAVEGGKRYSLCRYKVDTNRSPGECRGKQ